MINVQCLIAGGSLVFISCPSALAQSNIVPDNTLGNESSVVNVSPDNPLLDLITGGAQRGQNLFHSFEQFNVTEGRGAYFTSPSADIVNILSRVTGNNISEIFGTLGTNGASQPNLFLINPNGIVFGQNASLNVGGSFVATTASSIVFENGEFSATNVDDSPLLTVNMPIGLNFGNNPGDIINRASTENGLEISPSKTISLIGGNVTFDGGNIFAPGARVQLGGLQERGTVELNQDGSLVFSDNVVKGNVSFLNTSDSFTNQSKVDVTGDKGSILIEAKNINITDISLLLAGIGSNSGTVNSQAGDIVLNATNNVEILDNSTLRNSVGFNAFGNAGNITIIADSLLLKNANLNASISGASNILNINAGQGNTGNILIQANNSVSVENSLISNILSIEAIGDGGNITIESGSLSLTDGTTLQTIHSGQGNLGNIEIKTTKDTTLSQGSQIINRLSSNATGNSGNIDIQTNSLTLIEGSQIDASTFGQGNSGVVNIDAQDTIFIQGLGTGILDNETAIFNRVESFGRGNTGGININSKTLSLINTARIAANLLGQGDVGNLNINVTDLTLESGAQISTSAFPNSQGNAADLIINASESIELTGSSPTVVIGNNTSSLLIQNASNANPGNLAVTTKNLSIRDGAGISTINFAEGNGGDLTINASDSIELIGTANNSLVSSGVFSITNNFFSNSNGDAGNLTIDTSQLIIQDGASIDASNIGAGKAGAIRINASDFVELTGKSTDGIVSSVVSQTEGSGSAGDIVIFTEQLNISDEAKISVSGLDNLGSAGNINIFTNSIQLNNSASLSAETGAGQGNINLLTKALLLRRNSNITTNARGSAIGGNITIDTENLVAFPAENSDISANAENSFGGRVSITAQGIFGTESREIPTLQSDITATSQLGAEFNGEVAINTPDTDPLRGLDNLPNDVIDASNQMVRTCLTAEEEKSNKFVLTGRGGIPNNPTESFIGDATISAQWLTLTETTTQLSEAETTIENYQPTEIVEAKGWIINRDGKVILTATANNNSITVPWLVPNSCHDFQ